MSNEAKQKPIGASTSSPIVALTSDVKLFLQGEATADKFGKINLTLLGEKAGVSYDVIRRLWSEDAPTTSFEVVDTITTSFHHTEVLDNEIPLYRNPSMSKKQFFFKMRQRGCDVEWTETIPTIPV